MKISVFVLTRERPTDLKKCLDSILKQTKKAEEIVVVNNGSDETTAKLLKKYNVKVVDDSLQRLSHLFDVGWKNCRNEIIAFCADDTTADKKWLENIEKVFQRHPTAGVVHGPTISTCYPAGEMHRLWLLSQSNWLIKIITWPYFYFVYENEKILLPGKLFQSGAYSLGAGLKESKKYPEQEIDLATTTNMGIKKATLKKIKGFDQDFCFNHADGDLFVRIKKAGYKIIFNPEIIIHHHVRPGPSRAPFFIGRDTAYFLLKDIRPKTLRGWIGYFSNILFLNSYWFYAAIRNRQFKQLTGISGFFKGIWDYVIK